MAASTSLNFLRQALQLMSKGPGFERVLNEVKVVDGGVGRCVCEMSVGQEHLNLGGTLHGGFTALVVDSVSTLALMSNEGAPPGVSVDMNISYMKAAVLGDEIVIDANTVKLGKNVAFLSVDVKNKSTGNLLAHGRHTKYVS